MKPVHRNRVVTADGIVVVQCAHSGYGKTKTWHESSPVFMSGGCGMKNIVNAFDLKGQTFPLTVLELQSADIATIENDLKARVESAPDLFRQLPVVIDPGHVDRTGAEFSLSRLVDMLRSLGCVPVGVLGDDPGLRRYAASVGLGALSGKGRARTAPPSEQGPASSRSGVRDTLVVEKPVRSGQQVYAQGRNLVVLAAVSTGAEVLADGDIHIYGPLRGRALAGAAGNDRAGIYCLGLEAELVSVNGLYQISDELPGELMGRPARVFRSDDELIFSALSVGN